MEDPRTLQILFAGLLAAKIGLLCILALILWEKRRRSRQTLEQLSRLQARLQAAHEPPPPWRFFERGGGASWGPEGLLDGRPSPRLGRSPDKTNSGQ